MKDSFTIDELKDFLSEVKERNHLQYYYKTIKEEEHQVDMEQFYVGAELFIKDLEARLEEINMPEVEKLKKMRSYKNPIEALNHLWEHVDCSIINLVVCKFPDNGRGVLYDNYGSMILLPDTGTKFDETHPEADWTHSESYHIQYGENKNSIIFFVNIGEYSKLSNK